MALTTAQLQTLKTFIAANYAAIPANDDGAYEIARLMNLPASPVFVVWKTSVPTQEVGQAFVSTELAGLTTANTSRLQVLEQFSGGMFNPSRSDTRAGFDSIFSGAGGANTRAALLTLWKRSATVAEKLFASGTGSDASPAKMTVEGAISPVDVTSARNL